MSSTRRRPELLAPAGTPEKLEVALHFGADAVYLGLRSFSLRTAAGNFTTDELEWALGYAHERGRQVYVAVNIQPLDEDLAGIAGVLKDLQRLRPDGLIVADPGVLALVQQEAPDLPVHLSTQTSVTNAAAARWWLDHGAHRLVVARELHLDQLSALVRASDGGEIEAFAHGAVCLAWSGRCLLSLYWARRDPRKGHCAQACRWAYTGVAVEDARRPGQWNPVEQDERGTYLFDAKDLCALPVLDRLVATGVCALKIEGRTRSAHYVGVTVDVYRHALDRLAAGDLAGFRAALPDYLAELARPANRGFSTHFLTGDQNELDAYNPSGSYPDGRYDYVGRVVGASDSGLRLECRNPVDPGTVVEIRDQGLVSETTRVAQRALTDEVIDLPGRFKSGVGALVRLRAGGDR